MWKTSNKLWLITTAPLVIVGLGFIIFGLMTTPEALTDDGYSLKTFYYFMGGAFIVFPVLGALGVYYYYKRINDREMFLINEGIRGEAEILSREQTGTYINEQPQVKFKLLITTPDSAPYEVEHKEIVNLLDMGSIPEGKKVPVVVHPDNPEDILLLM
ncbi:MULTISPECIES: hypothetical protein [Methanobacterium]|jgi:hypothetical protein|uniref:Putative membrane protein n=1 Tax=Methanobacterium formicicum TaxID=2162 RepID=A0A089ZVL8_METFO|nr:MULTISPECIES: hypothetical protein [Methanobacterium]AIS32659.1 hypothetical protein BRM9_1851 [Methanobacterium formicicum]AXV39667.1 MAG: hypothetical protein CIT02_04760 [Methanobacterium sp. BAmetb5]KUK75752.1 MAG: Uncharacterized protein XD90_0022 [Methanobacterium sp. 42_16]MBF4476117.1 hypothetical protein [Methanobacterium formicicum]MDG3546519.1 hypothetical protein [Methanobacterium formicicum]